MNYRYMIIKVVEVAMYRGRPWDKIGRIIIKGYQKDFFTKNLKAWQNSRGLLVDEIPVSCLKRRGIDWKHIDPYHIWFEPNT